MANNNTVTVTYKINEDGSLKEIARDANQAAKSTENLTKSRNNYSKGEKGVIGATSNGTKAFSKMNQTLGGGNGLVAAYATLAANVFAATAAFNVFRRAAQVRQLEQGLIAVGAAAGQNLPDVARRLQDITDSAISSEQAMRATAVGISSGFRSDQLQKLAQVAKGASIALGRDMGDALDRLVRGTAKVEPEILDELGIIVRLDEAVQNYADKMGIAANSMNQFQRSQAFLNAVTEQGIAKYQDIAAAVDPNPYDKLAAALANLQKSFVNAINGAGKLSSFINYASENLSSLTAVATTLGLTVTRSVAPGLFTMAESAAESAKQLAAQQANLTENIDLAGKLPEKYKNAVKAMQEHGITVEGMAEAEDSLTRSIAARQGRLDADIEKGKLSQEQIENRTKGIQEMRARQEELTKAQNTLTLATSKQSQANAIAAASNLNFKQAFSELKTSVNDYSKGLKESETDGKKTTKMFNGLRIAGFAASGGIKAVGAALFTMLPYIGLIISAGTFLYTFLRDKFFPKDIVQDRIDKAIESFENFSEITAAFDRSTAEGGTRLANSYIAFAGILDQIQAKILEVTDANSKEFTDNIIAMEKELDNLQKRLGKGGDLSAEIVQLSRALSQGGDIIGKDRADALDRVAEIEKELESKAEKLAQLQKNSAAQVLQGAIQRLEIEREIAAVNDKTSPFTLNAMDKALTDLAALKTRLNEGKLTLKEFFVEFEKIKMFSADVRNSFNNVQQAIAGVNSETNKIAMAQKKPYEDLQNNVAGVIDLFTSLTEKSKEQVYLFGDIFAPTDQALEAQDLLAELESNLKNLKVPKSFQENINGAFVTTIDSVINYNTWITETQKNLKTLAETAKVAAVQSTAIGKAVQGIAGGEGISIDAQNTAYQAQVDYLEAGAVASAKIAGTTLEAYYLTEEGAKINAQIAQNKEKIVSETVKEQIVAQSLLRLDEQRNVLAQERVKNDLRIMKMQELMKAPGGKLTPEQEFKLALASAKATLEAAKVDLKLTEAKADVQYAVLEAQMESWGVEKSKQEEILGKLREQLNITKQIAEEKVRGAGIGVQETVLGNAAGTAASTPDVGFGMGVARAAQEGADNITAAATKVAAAKEQEKQAYEDVAVAQDQYNDASAKAAKGVEGAAKEQKQALNRLSDAKERAALASQILIDAEKGLQKAVIQTAVSSIQAAASAMATLGPDGEFAAALGSMSATLISSWTNVGEVFATQGATMAQKVGAVAGAIANSLGALAGVMNAQANARVASIDREIEAEKKRDGVSAASTAKLQAMEAKKEQIKKKAFETDKKLRIAQAIAATAAGIAAVLPIFALNPVIGGILMGIIAATGAAQIAILSGLSYEGGGSAPSTGPSKVAVGSRTNTVDMARANSPAGELAYARGQGGTGTGMTNYTPTPAFTGAKYRAAGGNTAFMVGEQGPELFVPDRPGTIVPADETKNIGGAPMNVSFSINTVDATGVEELLSGQRAHIIGMIREAANASGEGFLESVNILADQNSVMTRRR